jgi:hypothetical protein
VKKSIFKGAIGWIVGIPLFAVVAIIASVFGGLVYELGLRVFIALIAANLALNATKWTWVAVVWLRKRVSGLHFVDVSDAKMQGEAIGLWIGVGVGAVVLACTFYAWWPAWRHAFDQLTKWR